MDKIQLNKEIVLCRSAVKRARVCVVRKLIKKIKILRSCKNEQLKEKKFKKARRLAAEIHVMKTLRPDYVTKFALITEEYIPTGSNTKLKRKRNACAKLAKQKDFAKKIESIREKFSNWREELPLMLQSKKRNKPEDDETNLEPNEKGDEIVGNVNALDEGSERLGAERVSDVLEEAEDKAAVNGNINENLRKSTDKLPSLEVPKPNAGKESNLNGKVKKKRKKKSGSLVDSSEEAEEEMNKVNGRKREESETEQQNGDGNEEAEKIDDPFFIGKKIIAPKLMQKASEEPTENERERKRKVSDEAEEEVKASRGAKKVQKPAGKPVARYGEPLPEEDLHPSWKAKKIQMIKPFQGKKIKFE